MFQNATGGRSRSSTPTPNPPPPPQLFSGLVCLEYFTSICPDSSSHFQVAMEAIPIFSPSAENNSRVLERKKKKKTFMGWQAPLTSGGGCSSVPEADLFKSLLHQTTGMIRKQLCLIRCNHNWQVSQKDFVQQAQISVSLPVCCSKTALSQLETKSNRRK